MGWIKMSTKIKENWFFLNNFFLLGGGLWRNLLLSEIFSEFSFEIPKYECLTNMIDLTETSFHAFIQNSRIPIAHIMFSSHTFIVIILINSVKIFIFKCFYIKIKTSCLFIFFFLFHYEQFLGNFILSFRLFFS